MGNELTCLLLEDKLAIAFVQARLDFTFFFSNFHWFPLLVGKAQSNINDHHQFIPNFSNFSTSILLVAYRIIPYTLLRLFLFLFLYLYGLFLFLNPRDINTIHFCTITWRY